MNQTLKVSFALVHHVKQDGFACRDENLLAKPLGSRMAMLARLDSVQARQASRRELQSAGEELRPFFGRTLMPSILDQAFNREL